MGMFINVYCCKSYCFYYRQVSYTKLTRKSYHGTNPHISFQYLVSELVPIEFFLPVIIVIIPYQILSQSSINNV